MLVSWALFKYAELASRTLFEEHLQEICRKKFTVFYEIYSRTVECKTGMQRKQQKSIMCH